MVYEEDWEGGEDGELASGELWRVSRSGVPGNERRVRTDTFSTCSEKYLLEALAIMFQVHLRPCPSAYVIRSYDSCYLATVVHYV
jgi:hypothetical protein